jgi:Flp pilus assembly protein TadB
MPHTLSVFLAVIQVVAFIALFVAAWFILDHWHFVVAISVGALAASLYIERAYLRNGTNGASELP